MSIEQHYECESCGKRHVLRPDTSHRARVECPCGRRVEFNLAPRTMQVQSRTLDP